MHNLEQSTIATPDLDNILYGSGLWGEPETLLPEDDEDETAPNHWGLDAPAIGELKNRNTRNIMALASGKLRDRTRRTRSRGKVDVYITAEDFEEGAERDAFLLIYGSAWDLFENDDPDRRRLALSFFFCASDDAVTFDDAIAALGRGVRAEVFRSRIMMEFWLRERATQGLPEQQGRWIMPNLGFTARPLPEPFEHTVLAQCFDVPREAATPANLIWCHPGIDEASAISETEERLSREGYVTNSGAVILALESLLAAWLVSPVGHYGSSCLYFTAKNPILESGDTPANRAVINHYWARLF